MFIAIYVILSYKSINNYNFETCVFNFLELEIHSVLNLLFLYIIILSTVMLDITKIILKILKHTLYLISDLLIVSL